jgi:DNA-binding IclR family transcriptional regulator
MDIGKDVPVFGNRGKRAGERLQTVERAAEVLDLLVTEGTLTLKDVQERLHLGRTVAHRILQTWTALRYLNFDADSKIYRAGIKLLWAGVKVRGALDNPDLEARLRRLSAKLNLTANVGVLDGRLVVHVARSEVRNFRKVPAEIGSSLPAHATSIGRTLLAHISEQQVARLFADGELPAYTPHTISDLTALLSDLRRIRKRGYAVSCHMMETGVGSIAVPLRDGSGSVVAAMNAVGPIALFSSQEIRDRLLPEMRAVAEQAIDLPPILRG